MNECIGFIVPQLWDLHTWLIEWPTESLLFIPFHHGKSATYHKVYVPSIQRSMLSIRRFLSPLLGQAFWEANFASLLSCALWVRSVVLRLVNLHFQTEPLRWELMGDFCCHLCCPPGCWVCCGQIHDCLLLLEAHS
jgi:hypothetical protein